MTSNAAHTPNYTLNCQMSHEAAAMERFCQVVRIRGFRIARMAVESFEDQLDIALTLEGTRSITMLQAQLEKLQTVIRVDLQTPESAATSKTA